MSMVRIDYIYFVVDVSNSMKGVKLGSVNDAINNIVHRLKKVANSLNIEIKLVVLTFSDRVRWSSILPQSINSFNFEDLVVEASESNFGLALEELDEKLQKQKAVYDTTGETTIILFSDGLATDDYEVQMKKLNDNEMFVNSNRIAFTYGSDIFDLIKKPLCTFVSSENNVIVDDFISLNKLLFEHYR